VGRSGYLLVAESAGTLPLFIFFPFTFPLQDAGHWCVISAPGTDNTTRGNGGTAGEIIGTTSAW